VALFTNDIRAVPAALLLARAAGATIWQNIIFSVVTKVRGR
jgi:cation transport ATPase